ncbi:hypothetical protein HPB58_02035 [Priestia filamentosa]|nr:MULTISPECIES: hypothetical protein [Priestia]MED3724811.1 hypothetical protein [Priestia filamentosa]UOE60988.1 hypothetical protein HPB58_02035 [Priestia filamentosa]
MMFGFGFFLYFPEDKTEYIPAFITLILFFLAAIWTMSFIKKISKKQERQAKELEEKIKNTTKM